MSTLLVFLFLTFSASAGTQIINDCGDHLTAFEREPSQLSGVDEIGFEGLIQSYFPDAPLESRFEIDEAMKVIGHELWRLEAELEAVQARSPDTYRELSVYAQIRQRHSTLAVLLVALKKRQARMFQTREN